eukprot:755848-Hanusia_phi.AAC.3
MVRGSSSCCWLAEALASSAQVDSDRLAALQRVKAKAAALAHSQAARGQVRARGAIMSVVMPEAAAAAGAVKAPVDGETKLQAYLREEKALKDKIKRAEQAVAKSDKSEEKAAGRGRASAEGSVVSTLVGLARERMRSERACRRRPSTLTSRRSLRTRRSLRS